MAVIKLKTESPKHSLSQKNTNFRLRTAIAYESGN